MAEDARENAPKDAPKDAPVASGVLVGDILVGDRDALTEGFCLP